MQQLERVLTAQDGVSISIELEGYLNLDVEDIWPDGDAPEEVTAEAVAELMRQDTKRRTLDDWCLIDELRVAVHVHRRNPEYHGSAVLPGTEAPTPFFATHAEPW